MCLMDMHEIVIFLVILFGYCLCPLRFLERIPSIKHSMFPKEIFKDMSSLKGMGFYSVIVLMGK